MGLFDGLATAQLFTRGQYFPYADAHYKVNVTKVVPALETQKSGTAFVVETEVVESDNPNVKPGEARTWMVPLKNKSTAMGNILGFMVAVLGIDRDPEKIEEMKPHLSNIVDMAIADNLDNPMTNKTLCLRTERTKTKADGDFTVHVWSSE